MAFFFCSAALALSAAEPTKPPTNTPSSKEFFYRITFGSANDVAYLLKQGADPNARNESGWPALAIAASRKDSASAGVVWALADAGAKVDDADPDKHYPLHNAIQAERADVVQYLLSKGANFTLKNMSGLDALALAKRRSNREIIALVEAAIARSEQEKAAKIQAKKTPEYLNQLARLLSYYHCEQEYWITFFPYNYAEKFSALQRQALLEKVQRNIDATTREIDKYFTLKPAALQFLTSESHKRIRIELRDVLGHGREGVNAIGTQSDLKQRCGAIARLWEGKINNNE